MTYSEGTLILSYSRYTYKIAILSTRIWFKQKYHEIIASKSLMIRYIATSLENFHKPWILEIHREMKYYVFRQIQAVYNLNASLCNQTRHEIITNRAQEQRDINFTGKMSLAVSSALRQSSECYLTEIVKLFNCLSHMCIGCIIIYTHTSTGK